MDAVVARLRSQSASRATVACLGTILVSDDPRERANMRRKHVKAGEAGMRVRHYAFPTGASQSDVERAVEDLARDPGVHGIFVQLPLPPQLDAKTILARIPRAKDVDSPPATPAGVLEVLRLYEVPVAGKRVVVLGGAAEITQPFADAFASARPADVVIVDPDSAQARAATRRADILVAAAGRPRFLGAAFLKSGATVIDASSNRTPLGVVGDVDVEAIDGIAGALVPMPGGIGPATIACLLQNTWNAAQ